MSLMRMKYSPILFLLFIACGHKPKHPHVVKVINRDTMRYAKYPYIGTETDVRRLVSRIDSSNCAIFGGVGIAGEETEIYDCYLRLQDIAADSFWVELSYHKNPVARIYAFEALRTTNSPYLQEVKKRLNQDKQAFWSQSGCIGMEETVAWHVRISK